MSTIEHIKQLREETGAGIVDVRQALQEADGDTKKAKEILRKKGQHIAAKKAGRTASEGFVGSYIHVTGKIGAMVALACETDFVARTENFQRLAKDLAMHVAAMHPHYVRPEDVPAEVIEKEKEIYRAQLAKEGKPEQVMEKILTGKLAKFYSEVCLTEQPFVKDDEKTVGALLIEAVAALGENIQIVSFSYLAL